MVCVGCTALVLLVTWLAYKLADWLIRGIRLGNLSGKYVLITGCDTGFGHATAKKLDSLGCHVIAGCLTETGETELRKACSSRLHTVTMDVTKPDQLDKVYKEVEKLVPKELGLWGVINNAGIAGNVGPCEWLTIDDYRKVMDVNFYGVVDVSVKFAPLVKKARGRIVNTASVLGRVALEMGAPYCASKFCVEAFSDIFRREMSVFGVSVLLVEPGFHKTNIACSQHIYSMLKKSWNKTSDNVKKEYGPNFCDDVIKTLEVAYGQGILCDDISGVVDAYTHAIIAKFPRSRYLIGKDAKLFWIPLSRLPTWVGDKVLNLLAKDKPVPAAVAVR